MVDRKMELVEHILEEVVVLTADPQILVVQVEAELLDILEMVVQVVGGSSSVGGTGGDGSGGGSGGGGGSFAQTYTSTQPGRASSGGGTGIFGQGSNGTGGSGATSASGLGNATSAEGGSNGTDGDLNGGLYGGGGRSGFLKTDPSDLYLAGGSGGGGAVRIIRARKRQTVSINKYSRDLV